jgi:hypothetical protein
VNIRFRKAGDLEYFARRRSAGNDSDAIPGQAESFSDGDLHRDIRFATLSRRRDSHLECIAQPTDDAVP